MKLVKPRGIAPLQIAQALIGLGAIAYGGVPQMLDFAGLRAATLATFRIARYRMRRLARRARAR